MFLLQVRLGPTATRKIEVSDPVDGVRRKVVPAGALHKERDMSQVIGWIHSFWSDDGGATAAEYGVMLVLIIIVCLGAIAALGDRVSTMYVDIENNLP